MITGKDNNAKGYYDGSCIDGKPNEAAPSPEMDFVAEMRAARLVSKLDFGDGGATNARKFVEAGTRRGTAARPGTKHMGISGSHWSLTAVPFAVTMSIDVLPPPRCS